MTGLETNLGSVALSGSLNVAAFGSANAAAKLTEGAGAVSTGEASTGALCSGWLKAWLES
ncbi:MAG: hypothetical protein R3E09_05325 [Novosphingobium sp.]